MRISTFVIVIGLLSISWSGGALGDSDKKKKTEKKKKKANPYFFNGNSTFMELSGPLIVNFYNVTEKTLPFYDTKVHALGDIVESVKVKTDVVPVVVGTSKGEGKEGTFNTLKVAYNGIQCHGEKNNGSTLRDISLTLSFVIANGSWVLNAISSEFDATVVVNGSAPIAMKGEESFVAAVRTGYTPSKADLAYGRQYTTGSPSKGLSWTCDNQIFAANASKKEVGKLAVGVELPGLEMQPFDVSALNGTTLKFGFNWDCDPIISAKLWEIFFVVFILIVLFLWSLMMMMSLNTPTRFDDPKGKPLSVPLHD